MAVAVVVVALYPAAFIPISTPFNTPEPSIFAPLSIPLPTTAIPVARLDAKGGVDGGRAAEGVNTLEGG